MAYVVKSWKRAFIYTDPHADVIDRARLQDALRIKRDFKPHKTIGLGDWSSWNMFREGAKDYEISDPLVDARAITRFWDQMEPDLEFEGNHDYRIWKAMRKNDGIIAGFARELMANIQAYTKKNRIEVVPFHARQGWRKLGAHFMGHGYRHGKHALEAMRTHLPGPIIQGDLHTDRFSYDDSWLPGCSHVVGGLVDYSKLLYEEVSTAQYKRSHGLILMEYREDEDRIWHLTSKPGEALKLPNFKPGR
jgi:hypothetical protein